MCEFGLPIHAHFGVFWVKNGGKQKRFAVLSSRNAILGFMSYEPNRTKIASAV